MPPQIIFLLQTVLSYVAWLFCFRTYVWPRLKSMDLTTGILAIAALAAVNVRPVFWTCVVAFNCVGILDFVLDYYHASRVGLPELAGQLGAAYVIPVIYVPLLMITHVTAFYLLLRSRMLQGSAIAITS